MAHVFGTGAEAMTHIPHLSAPPGEVYWRHSLPGNTGSKMLLRTIGDVAVIGCWTGAIGQYYKAWSPLPKDGPA